MTYFFYYYLWMYRCYNTLYFVPTGSINRVIKGLPPIRLILSGVKTLKGFNRIKSNHNRNLLNLKPRRQVGVYEYVLCSTDGAKVLVAHSDSFEYFPFEMNPRRAFFKTEMGAPPDDNLRSKIIITPRLRGWVSRWASG